LRFTSLYYPGWQATRADGSVLPTYPNTNLGLLTVDLPPGDHRLSLRWTGTALQRLATWLSLATLALLLVFVWRTSRRRWLAAVPLSLLILGVIATLSKPSLTNTLKPSQPLSSPSLEMVGYRLEQGGAHELNVYPYWYARRSPPANTLISWQLRDEAGGIAYEATRQPFFDSQLTSNWPPGTLVDDAYRLAFPPGLAAGSYELAVQVAEGDSVTSWKSVGTVLVASSVPRQSQPAHPLEIGFGGLLKLVGFDLMHDRRAADASSLRPVVVQPGDRLEYVLSWQALQRLAVRFSRFCTVR
jgi:hypothetical protein